MVHKALKDETVCEIPTGKYDAVRTLRHALQQAERGEITDVIIITNEREKEDDSYNLDCAWSDLQKRDILWMQRWFNSWLNKRYFGNFHSDPD